MVLLVFPTENEAAQSRCYMPLHSEIELLITGVGILSTAYTLTARLAQGNVERVIMAGIAGSYDTDKFPLGSVVEVASEQLIDMGREEGEKFVDLFDMGLQYADTPPFRRKLLLNPAPCSSLPQVAGGTVNCCSGTKEIIAARRAHHIDIESMEGAALHYVCLQQNIAFGQIRSVSNSISEREKQVWDIPLALHRLHQVLPAILSL